MDTRINWRFPTAAGWLVLLVLLIASSIAHAEDEPVIWQSRNDTFEGLTKEFASLYRDLLTLKSKGGTIPTNMVAVPEGKSVTEVLRDRQLFDGKYLPRQLDVLTCGLNPSVCRVTPGKDGDVRADDAKATWRIQPSEVIVVPDIRFQPVIVHKAYQKSASDTLESIVVDDRQGCDSFDEACRKYVENLNRRLSKPINNDYSGKIVVPTKAYRAVIPVETRSATKGDLVKIVPAMNERSIPGSTAVMNDTTADSNAEGDRALVLRLIKHPLADGGTMKFPATARTNVAVFDSWVDRSHCMFQSITVLDPEKLGANVPRAGVCGERGSASGPQDHGTHVVGLIGTRLDAKGGPGTNPYATIRAVCMDTAQFRLPLYLAKQSDRLRELYQTEAPDVVNLSFEYTLTAEQGRNDVFRTAIRELESETLFIVSAGNDRVKLAGGDCRVRPACFDERNIVTVGALDLGVDAPALFKTRNGGSNYGDHVHLGAPGQNILSTITGDRMGVLTGTSQAAPTVAGAASLLYLFESKLRPIQVKNRLVYTSDLYAGLYDKMQGGRLNVTRLLAYKNAIVELRGGRHLVGSWKRLPDKSVRFADTETNETFSLNFVQIRRLMYNESLGYYTLFYNDEVGRDTGILKRRFATLVDGAAQLAFFIPRADSPDKREEVAVGDIVDYVSPLLL
jgi:hypothetical protein